MKTIKKISVVLILALFGLNAQAQQDPMFTHYMYNTLAINPAYAGSRDALTVTALNRSQWIGFDGAPITQTLTAHSPLRNDRIGLGLSVTNDKIRPTNNTSFFVDFSYILKLNDRSKLAIGGSAGASVFQAQLSDLEIDVQSDPLFQSSISNKIMPNFGFGVYYSREQFYAGVSAPKLLQNNYTSVNQPDGTVLLSKAKRHYYLIAGALFNLNENLTFKPTTLVKVTESAPIQADLTASFVIKKILTLGVAYRTGDSVGALIGFDISPQFHLGYSFDWSHSLRTGLYNQGSHELMLRYDFIFSSKRQIHSPRNF